MTSQLPDSQQIQPNSAPKLIGDNVTHLLQWLDKEPIDGRLREELKTSLKQLADVKFALDESSIVVLTDSRGRIQYVNDKFCEISRYSRDELIGQDHRIINSGYHDKSFMKELWQTISSGQVWRGDIKNKAKDGSPYWVNTTIVPFLDAEGKPYQYLAIRNEVTRLKQVEEDLQQLMIEMMHIQEEERRRFSRELHDGIGQSLFSLLIQFDRILSEEPRDDLQKLRGDVSNIIEDVRGLAWELRPSVLDDLGVVPAIRTFIDNYSKHNGIRVSFDNELRKRLGVQKETVIYRVIQEALTNVAKYAQTDEAAVRITDSGDIVEVQIVDEGRGFTRETKGKGVGLSSMEERAKGVNGQLEVQSKPGQGTTVTLRIAK
ncbi:PAS domain S-box protein [Paenibacillus chartarius]|uniref:Oxygen sensor histidine kinase NreB n=1 Tax=Paenibacillus chartarius TaxID=747481 RepID=A0ABV6DHW0_9BACL